MPDNAKLLSTASAFLCEATSHRASNGQHPHASGWPHQVEAPCAESSVFPFPIFYVIGIYFFSPFYFSSGIFLSFEIIFLLQSVFQSKQMIASRKQRATPSCRRVASSNGSPTQAMFCSFFHSRKFVFSVSLPRRIFSFLFSFFYFSLGIFFLLLVFRSKRRRVRVLNNLIGSQAKNEQKQWINYSYHPSLLY